MCAQTVITFLDRVELSLDNPNEMVNTITILFCRAGIVKVDILPPRSEWKEGDEAEMQTAWLALLVILGRCLRQRGAVQIAYIPMRRCCPG